MHPASNPAEAPPPSNNDGPRPASHLPGSPENHLASNAPSDGHLLHPDTNSPPARKDTSSSISTAVTGLTSATVGTDDTPGTPYSSVASSPTTFASTQAVFSARDGTNVAPQRRASRRRTGPLTAVQRERAHLIRKMGACPDCRRRRVACHPNHHNMTWEDAAKRFRSHEPSTQALSPISGPPISPAQLNSRGSFSQDAREMDLDISPTQQHVQPALSRTPLPSGPRPDKHTHLPPLPGFESFRTDLQGSADRILGSPFRSRYGSVSVLLVRWQDDDDLEAQDALNELAKTFHDIYHYTVYTKSIPSRTEDSRTPWLWLTQAVTEFVGDHNQRDCLKIFYYSGYSYLDGGREPVLASSKHADPASVIRWSSIQQFFENTRSDALLLMDCAYYPTHAKSRGLGMLELIAACAGEDHVELLGRSAFTRALATQLRKRIGQPFKEPFSAAELHAKLVSLYPEIAQERHPEREVVTRFPMPLSMQVSGSKTLPSILLAPLRHDAPTNTSSGTHISITFRLTDDSFDMDAWAEWFRTMPGGIREARVEGPYRDTLR
ncbi:uncharacterized protein C8A04DRAFT_30528 [Dichotomopilus funicola]|uniref:Uncharacterized protein n=1 Tax=Dichotomopilus funicola TaxID=1934379 RepID=A0AAN6UZ35_9PEZI|nr:hypothetical protein C8A04DRAFT_30528 [Dichotomopilus funicola]